MMQAKLIIYTSPNGRDGWLPIDPHKVPEWLKRPDIVGRLVAGEMCMDPKSSTGTDWFMAKRAITQAEKTAQERRERRQAKRMTH